ncbi:Crp/Fnr family transcriptional regulator [Pacificimonas sp. WHA3]|uniref:Crp/Fnr family transcriptional regulator n=1 Tax=Pacificimonas pallii TaxID=2827236 RepID=A0ABS6SGK0_9SPHN|nr:Crp/Fnr family transcriptional regulator [Pacificimonas pallii]MBV7257532.1 Crp/Fnr family transcriptional regulator [Pacificimonas pallii]
METADRCRNCSVQSQALCHVLDADALSDFASAGREKRLFRGETLVWQGDREANCATVTKGALKLATLTEDGEERIVGMAYPGDFVGSPFGGPSPVQITALVDSELCLVALEAFRKALANDRVLETELLRRTLDELTAARLDRSRMGGAGARLAGLILNLDARAPVCRAGPDYIELPFSRAEIGQLLDMRIETVSREFGALEETGAIRREGRRGLHILDRDRLRAA